MSNPTRLTRRNPYRRLLHLLNQRYHAEWVRAELLAAELAAVKRTRTWRAVNLLRRVKNWFVPFRPKPEPPPAAHATPYTPPATGPAAGRVSVVIPFRDQPELLANCLRSLRASTAHDFEVVLVDNGSVEPATKRLLERAVRRPGFHVLDAAGPFNFSALCNAGAAAATGDFLLFLNNDTEVLARDWLEHLTAIAADPRVGAVGATLLYPDRTIQHAGLFPRTDGEWFHPYRGRSANEAGENGELLRPRCVPAVTAACLLVRRDVFDTLGGFDERFPVTHNDVDLCERLRGRGLLVVVTPGARLIHYESLSRGFGSQS
jgi:GT2 family glycosyltransferase